MVACASGSMVALFVVFFVVLRADRYGVEKFGVPRWQLTSVHVRMTRTGEAMERQEARIECFRF